MNSNIYDCGVSDSSDNLVYVQNGELLVEGSQIFNNVAQISLIDGNSRYVNYSDNYVHNNKYRKITNESLLRETGRFENNTRMEWN